jgi:F-type H+-transporting ATPase subunit gamma
MPNTREVKNRLRGVRKTRQITRAMKMVATVKLRHAQTALANARPYAERMRELAANLLAGIDRLPDNDGSFAPRRLKKVLLIIVASDRGLCGSMNGNLFRSVMKHIDGLATAGERPEIELFLIGRKARDYFRFRQNAVAGGILFRIRDAINFSAADAGQLGRMFYDLYGKENYGRIDVFYNEVVSTMQHRPKRFTLLPFDFLEIRRNAAQKKPAASFIFEPPPEEMLADVVSACVVSSTQTALLEAEVAELAARMLMMDLATKNADDLISAMQLTMNKLRQLLITRELADITTGAEAVG